MNKEELFSDCRFSIKAEKEGVDKKTVREVILVVPTFHFKNRVESPKKKKKEVLLGFLGTLGEEAGRRKVVSPGDPLTFPEGEGPAVLEEEAEQRRGGEKRKKKALRKNVNKA